MKAKIFLGGTCNNSTWRDELIPLLKVDYFNPVVEDWTPECQAEERRQKDDKCNIHLYVITSAMIGVFSIAEAVASAHLPDIGTIFHVCPEGFGKHELESLKATLELIESVGAVGNMGEDNTMDELARMLNIAITRTEEEMNFRLVSKN